MLLYDFTRARQGAARRPVMKGRQVRGAIGTPRRLQAIACAPTARTLGDFGTSIAFCLDLNRTTPPQGAIVKSEFICLAMGYPPDWTEE